MLHSCDVEKCEDTSAAMEKSGIKDERSAWPERQIIATRIIHIYQVFLKTNFQMM